MNEKMRAMLSILKLLTTIDGEVFGLSAFDNLLLSEIVFLSVWWDVRMVHAILIILSHRVSLAYLVILVKALQGALEYIQ